MLTWAWLPILNPKSYFQRRICLAREGKQFKVWTTDFLNENHQGLFGYMHILAQSSRELAPTSRTSLFQPLMVTIRNCFIASMLPSLPCYPVSVLQCTDSYGQRSCADVNSPSENCELTQQAIYINHYSESLTQQQQKNMWASIQYILCIEQGTYKTQKST